MEPIGGSVGVRSWATVVVHKSGLFNCVGETSVVMQSNDSDEMPLIIPS